MSKLVQLMLVRAQHEMEDCYITYYLLFYMHATKTYDITLRFIEFHAMTNVFATLSWKTETSPHWPG